MQGVAVIIRSSGYSYRWLRRFAFDPLSKDMSGGKNRGKKKGKKKGKKEKRDISVFSI